MDFECRSFNGVMSFEITVYRKISSTSLYKQGFPGGNVHPDSRDLFLGSEAKNRCGKK